MVVCSCGHVIMLPKLITACQSRVLVHKWYVGSARVDGGRGRQHRRRGSLDTNETPSAVQVLTGICCHACIVPSVADRRWRALLRVDDTVRIHFSGHSSVRVSQLVGRCAFRGGAIVSVCAINTLQWEGRCGVARCAINAHGSDPSPRDMGGRIGSFGGVLEVGSGKY